MGQRQGRSGSGIHAADGNPIQGTRDGDGGFGRNSRVYHTPDAGRTDYIAAEGFGPETETYVLSVAEGDALILTDGILAAPLAVATEPHRRAAVRNDQRY